MIKLNDESFNTLMKSNQGLHLSAYVEHSEDLVQLKAKLKKIIIDSSYHLQLALTPDELMNFLSPIEILMEDNDILKKVKNNFAIFRTKRSFKILSIPIPFKEICVVADSFHIKPILKWLQNDKRFLLMGITNQSISIYKGTAGKMITLVDRLNMQQGSAENFIANSLDSWFNDFLENNPTLRGYKLYIAAKANNGEKALEHIHYTPKYKHLIYPRFARNSIRNIMEAISLLQKEEEFMAFENILTEYYIAENQNLTQDNIFEICKSAISGNIKKLIIEDGINVFGKICKDTGDLTIHYDELDHEDDDILDDLAQTVLLNGGEVIIAQKEKVPGPHSVVAILDPGQPPVVNIQQPETFISKEAI